MTVGLGQRQTDLGTHAKAAAAPSKSPSNASSCAFVNSSSGLQRERRQQEAKSPETLSGARVRSAHMSLAATWAMPLSQALIARRSCFLADKISAISTHESAQQRKRNDSAPSRNMEDQGGIPACEGSRDSDFFVSAMAASSCRARTSMMSQRGSVRKQQWMWSSVLLSRLARLADVGVDDGKVEDDALLIRRRNVRLPRMTRTTDMSCDRQGENAVWNAPVAGRPAPSSAAISDGCTLVLQ